MAKFDVKMSLKKNGTNLRPCSDKAFQVMATVFFEETWVWEGNTLIVTTEKTDAVVAILEDAGLIIG